MRFARIHRFWRNDDGSALLEGAIVIPFLFVLVLGTLEFSFYFFQQHLVSTGVRDAARYLARTDPLDGSAQATAQNLAATGLPGGGTARRVSGFDPADVVIDASTLVANTIDPITGNRPYREASAECGGPDNIRVIRVTGNLTYASPVMLGFFGLTLPNIAVTHTERCIGVG